MHESRGREGFAALPITCSRRYQHGRASVLALVTIVAAIVILAMFVSSTLLFDRSILQPIPGAYTGAT